MIISLSGLISSGKDTVAEMLVEQHGFKRDSFAGTLKDAVAVIFGWDREVLEGKTPAAREQREQIDQWWAARLNNPELSPRWILQHFGTEVCRNNLHTDIWVASLENKLRSLSNENIVISDARFTNELCMLKNAGAKMVCVSRGPKPAWWNTASAVYVDPLALAFMENSGIHRSEWEWAGYNFDVQIDNNGTLDDLAHLTKQLIT